MNTPVFSRWQVCLSILAFLLSSAFASVVLYGVYRVRQLPSLSLEMQRGDEAVMPAFRFVGSSRGKYYYPVLSERGQELSMKYRLYFTTEEEAQAAGFVRWEPN